MSRLPEGKKIGLVTGASSGVGRILSNELVKRGYIVIGLARSVEKLAAVQKECGAGFIPYVCDVSDVLAVQEVSCGLHKKGIVPSLFFLNAGMAGQEVVEKDRFDFEKHHRIMDTNYFGVLAFVSFWKKVFEKDLQEGLKMHFIVTSSVNAIWAPPGGGAYSASKAAISKAFDSLSLAYAGEKDLKFSSVYLGPVNTQGLHGTLPFKWSARKAALYMVNFAEGRIHSPYPFFFTKF